MKCCAFGIVRMDIHAYQEIDNLDEHEEIKINEMNMWKYLKLVKMKNE